MTLADVMRMDEGDVMKLSDGELRLAIRVASAAANKRLKRLEAAGYNSPAAQGASRSGGKFGIKNALRSTDTPTQIRARLVNELRRVRQFLESETSTVTGARRWEDQLDEVFGVTEEEGYTKEEVKDFRTLISDIYDQIARERPDLVQLFRPSEVYDIIHMEVAKEWPDVDEVRVRNNVIKILERLRDAMYGGTGRSTRGVF